MPAATKDTVDPDTVHTEVVEEAYETESELDAEADKAKEPVVNDYGAGSVRSDRLRSKHVTTLKPPVRGRVDDAVVHVHAVHIIVGEPITGGVVGERCATISGILSPRFVPA